MNLEDCSPDLFSFVAAITLQRKKILPLPLLNDMTHLLDTSGLHKFSSFSPSVVYGLWPLEMESLQC